jgi:Galactose-binding domain-like
MFKATRVCVAVILLSSSIFFVGCGGGNGKKTSTQQSSSSTSSSSTGPATTETPIFIDELTSDKGVFSSYVQLQSGQGAMNFNGTTPSHIEWQVINTNEPGHNEVVEVLFNANDPLDQFKDNGWFGISIDEKENIKDFSQYRNGAISFDMKVIENGLIPDVLEFKMECIYPCASDELWVEYVDKQNIWKTYTISFQKLIDAGLDITKVNNLFVFKPSWGLQIGQYRMQIDNIKLLPSYTVPQQVIPPKPTTSQTITFFQNGSVPDFLYDVTNNFNQSNVVVSEIIDGSNKVIDLSFISLTSLRPEFFIYPVDGMKFDTTNFYHGNIKFDLKVISYGGNTGNIRINSFCGYPCRATPHYSIGRPLEGQWQTYSIPISEMVNRGLNLNRIFNPLFLQFTGTSHLGLHIQLNNIRWEYVVTP